MPLVVVPDDTSGLYAASADIEALRADATIEIHGSHCADEAELIRRVRGADAIVTFRPAFTRFPAAVLEACPNLRLISVSGTGVDDVDVATASARGIAVANVVGPSDRAVAEHCLALTLAVARQIARHDREIRAGKWHAHGAIELGGRTLGIVGLSAIARTFAPIATALGMRVLSWSRNNDPERAGAAGAEAAPLERVLGESDVVSVHLRLNDETRGFIGERELARMKPGAILINTARGEIVDEPAMLTALASGALRGAGLDVFATAPLPPDHPLTRLDNVVMTPVTGWNTVDAADRMIRRSVENVVGFLSGKAINVVNPQVLAPAPGS